MSVHMYQQKKCGQNKQTTATKLTNHNKKIIYKTQKKTHKKMKLIHC